jgi:hypothetical protein
MEPWSTSTVINESVVKIAVIADIAVLAAICRNLRKFGKFGNLYCYFYSTNGKLRQIV